MVVGVALVALGAAVADFCGNPIERFEHGGPERVVGASNDEIRSRSDEVKGNAERRAFGEAAFEMDARLIDLEIGFESVEFLVDGFDDGLGGDVVAVGEVYFHKLSG